MDDYKFTKVSISQKNIQLWTLLLTDMPLLTCFFNGTADRVSDF